MSQPSAPPPWPPRPIFLAHFLHPPGGSLHYSVPESKLMRIPERNPAEVTSARGNVSPRRCHNGGATCRFTPDALLGADGVKLSTFNLPVLAAQFLLHVLSALVCAVDVARYVPQVSLIVYSQCLPSESRPG